MSDKRSLCQYSTWKWLVFVIDLTWSWKIARYLMVSASYRDVANGVFHAGEALEAGFAWILCMSRFWEVGKVFAWAIV